MNENLIYIAENIDVSEDWPDGMVYASVMSSQRPYKTLCFHSELSNIDLTKPINLNWFTKEEVVYAQQKLKPQKYWVSFEESGVPPVGTLLMNFAGEKREVVLVCDDHIVCRALSEGITGYSYKVYHFNHWDSYNLKPWKDKTDEDKAVETMIEFASEHDMVITPYVRKFMRHLYKEIKSGKIKI